MRTSLVFALPLLSLFAAACGDVVEADLDAAEEEAEARIAYDYRCEASVDRYNTESMVVLMSLRGTKATLTKVGSPSQTGTYNAAYAPRSAANANKAQYKNFNPGALPITQALLDRTLRAGGRMLRPGFKGGYMRIEQSGSGYWRANFTCQLGTTTSTGGGTSSSGARTIEGATFTADQATKALAAANGATEAQLRAALITGRSLAGILGGRTFSSLESVAGAPYVGKTTLERLRAMNFTPTTPAPAHGTDLKTIGIVGANALLASVNGDVTKLEGEDPDGLSVGLSTLDDYTARYGYGVATRFENDGHPFLLISGTDGTSFYATLYDGEEGGDLATAIGRNGGTATWL